MEQGGNIMRNPRFNHLFALLFVVTEQVELSGALHFLYTDKENIPFNLVAR